MLSLPNSDALRVARALAGQSQREVEALVGIARKSIIAAENGGPCRPTTIAKLRSYYEEMGIQFLGTVDLGSGIISEVGARWRLPNSLPPEITERSAYRTEPQGTAFSAARALVNYTQSEAAQLSKIADHKVRSLETGIETDRAAYSSLRTFYEACGVEFLGWGDVTLRIFYGVGVRWHIGVLQNPSQVVGSSTR